MPCAVPSHSASAPSCYFTARTCSAPRRFLQARATIQHWQLRDLLQSTGTANEIAYVSGPAVNILNTRTQTQSSLLKDLPFAPTSLAVGMGWVAVGGQRSQICIKALQNPNPSLQQSNVGGSINNALCIAPDAWNSVPRLYVCNNDETIKVFELPSMQRLNEVKVPFAVNNVSLSPDGKFAVAAGDSSQVIVFALNPQGSTFEQVGAVRGAEAGFSCSWNRHSTEFAVSFQDGTVRVWDLRMSLGAGGGGGGGHELETPSPVAMLRATQQGNRNAEACRTVKFSTGGPSVDLLAFAEHLNVVNLIDARTWAEGDRQVLRVDSGLNASQGAGVNVCGVDWGVDSRYLYVGLEGTGGILEYEMDLAKRRSFPQGSLC
jgi:WD40 repeat protein